MGMAGRTMTILILMGVSGSGKTTIAAELANRLGWPMLEGDALHPPANIAKMSAGMPLTDEDRWPWLRAIAAKIESWRASGSSGIVTCSALKRAYRDVLVHGRSLSAADAIGRRRLSLPGLPAQDSHTIIRKRAAVTIASQR